MLSLLRLQAEYRESAESETESLMARQAALPPEPALGEGECAIQEAVPPQVCGIVENHPEWDEYNDWQTAVKRGETKLPFEEWKKEKGK